MANVDLSADLSSSTISNQAVLSSRAVPTSYAPSVPAAGGDGVGAGAGSTVVLDRLAARFDKRWLFRFLIACWFVPAAGQFVLGASGTLGVPVAPTDQVAHRLGLTWAVVIVLALPTLLFGARWIVVDWDQVPSWRGLGRGWVHGSAIVIMAATVPLVPMLRAMAPSLMALVLSVTAVSGLVGLSILPRWLAEVPARGFSLLAAFAAVVLFELTVGWLHLWFNGPAASALLAVEGLALAVASVGAALVVDRPEGEGCPRPVAPIEDLRSTLG